MTADTLDDPKAENTAADAPAGDRPIIFFDGVCGLCNRTVDFILDRDRDGTFLFSPLQGETAKRHLAPGDVESLGSMVLRIGGTTYRQSSAVSRMLMRLPGVWKVLGAMLWLIPWPLRHLGYKIVAANRYRLFGRKETCRLPTPEQFARFLP
ncbi:MAG: thiol-disulfide oxidoreductase DCC family protein [Planctomycetaceae bacterium]